MSAGADAQVFQMTQWQGKILKALRQNLESEDTWFGQMSVASVCLCVRVRVPHRHMYAYMYVYIYMGTPPTTGTPLKNTVSIYTNAVLFFFFPNPILELFLQIGNTSVKHKKSKNPKTRKPKTPKIQKSKNPKMQKSKKPKIHKQLQDSVDVKRFGFLDL